MLLRSYKFLNLSVLGKGTQTTCMQY